MRGRLPTFAAVVRYGLISSFSSADVCRRLSAEPSHGENRGSSSLGSANDFRYLRRYDVFSSGGFNFPAHRNLRVSEGVENLLR